MYFFFSASARGSSSPLFPRLDTYTCVAPPSKRCDLWGELHMRFVPFQLIPHFASHARSQALTPPTAHIATPRSALLPAALRGERGIHPSTSCTPLGTPQCLPQLRALSRHAISPPTVLQHQVYTYSNPRRPTLPSAVGTAPRRRTPGLSSCRGSSAPHRP